MAAGWRVGVVAQSHAVVENMLAAVVERGLFPAERVAKLAGTSQRPDFPWAEWSRATVQQRCAGGANGEGFVFGGTAWSFSNASLFEQASLDLLVVDEAGQFSLANTLACRRCRLPRTRTRWIFRLSAGFRVMLPLWMSVSGIFCR